MNAALAIPYEPTRAPAACRKLASGVSALSGELASAFLAVQPANDTGENGTCGCDFAAESLIWVSKDPIGFGGGDVNLYAYAADDPVNARDPSGLVDMEGAGPGGGWEGYKAAVVVASLGADGAITLQNFGGVTTVLGADGSITVTRGGQILLSLVK